MNLKSLVPLPIKKRLKKLLGGSPAVKKPVSKAEPAYYCPVCSSSVHSFNPLSAHYLEQKNKYGWPYTYDDAETINPEQYSCPVCSTSDRSRLYALYLKEKFSQLPVNQQLLLIDFAPHLPLQKFIKKYNFIDYRSADLFMEGVDDKVDITDMTIYPDNHCDVFICSHVLEHVSDDRRALRELYRILKPGGWGILMVPINLVITTIDEDPAVTDIGERWRRFGQDDHIRLYSKQGFIDRVMEAGFRVNQLGSNYFGLDTFRKNGITDRSVLYVVEK